MTLFLSNDDVGTLLPMDECIQVLDDAFRQAAKGEGESLVRQTLYTPNGRLRVMVGCAPGFDAFGLKTYGGGANIVLLFSVANNSLEAIVESGDLSRIRTGAAAGLATKYMAAEEAHNIGVIGTGGQTNSQVEAIRSVRPIKHVKVYSRRPEPREAFAAELAEELGMEVTPVASVEECITDSDIVITATGSRDPVFDGAWLKPGAHINAIGATTPGRVEIDEATIGRCDVVVVESVAQAKVECGELILAEERGTFLWSKAVELRHLVAGSAPARSPSPSSMTWA